MIKKISSFLLVFLYFFSFAQISFGHLAGQPPFFKINGVFTDLYPVPTTSVVDFRLPQDKPPKLFTVGEAIQFEMDKNSMPVPPQVVDVTTFDWDFGDDSAHGSGLVNTHSYKRPGSYFLEVTAKTSDLPQPQLIQSIIMHVAPNGEYKMPEAKILVNGQSVQDPLLDDVKVSFGEEMTFDASQSVVGTTAISEYIWDLGNGKTANGKTITVSYDKDQYAFFPVLRIVDQNGIISDAFIQVTNKESQFSQSNSLIEIPPHVEKNLPIIVLGVVVGLSLIFGPFVYSRFKK